MDQLFARAPPIPSAEPAWRTRDPERLSPPGRRNAEAISLAEFRTLRGRPYFTVVAEVYTAAADGLEAKMVVTGVDRQHTRGWPHGRVLEAIRSGAGQPVALELLALDGRTVEVVNSGWSRRVRLEPLSDRLSGERAVESDTPYLEGASPGSCSMEELDISTL